MLKNRRHSGDESSEKSGDLVRRFSQRDPRVLADMYDLYWRLVYFLIARIVQNAEVAEDLVQECFLRAWDGPEQLTGNDDRALGQWLMAIARNRALEYLGRASVFAPHNVSPESAALIAEAFHDLSQKQKQIIELAYCEGLYNKGIAELQTADVCEALIPITPIMAV